MRLPRIIAHRGASADAPENTLAAFKAAVDQGAGWLECDVRLARDGTPVVLHDSTLDRTTDGVGKVAMTSREQLAKLDAGTWFGDAFRGEPIPTLTGLLDWAQATEMGLNLELKAESDDAAMATGSVVAGLLNEGFGSFAGLLISSFERTALTTFSSQRPNTPVGLLVDGWPTDADLQWASANGCATIHLDGRADPRHSTVELAPALTAIRASGLEVLAYTINDPHRAKVLLEAGATAVITDQPGQMAAALAARR